jgi:glucan 1,3-beta-glucosidase
MRFPLGVFVVSALVIAGAWFWLGAPVPMPPSPLAADGKLYCVSYAPFRGKQTPLDPTTRIEPWQIEEDFTRLSKLTGCVRTYSVENGLDKVPEIAERHGLKVLHGIWLSGNPVKERDEIETSIALAKQYPDTIQAIVVGNEVLLRGEYSGASLARIIRDVKARVSVPVTYADVWEYWLRYPEVYAAVDFVTIHILPYWEDFPIPARDAADHVASIRRKVAADFPGKDILIGETGWPSAGRMREGALPSPANQARVIHEILEIAKRENFRVNVIEAFDQPWKRALEGTVGGHWGFLDADTRAFKFAWGQPVSNHPAWPWQALGGIAFAALLVSAAFGGSRRDGGKPPPPWLWLGVAVDAVAGGVFLPWALANAPVESLGIGGWVRSAGYVLLAAAAPIVGAMALMRLEPAPPLNAILGRAEDRPPGAVMMTLGMLLVLGVILSVQVALGLVFNPRYLDFPYAPLTAGIVPFFMLSVLLPRRRGRRAAAELAIAAALTASAIYIAFNEGFANWQAVWLAAVLVVFAITLLRARDERS